MNRRLFSNKNTFSSPFRFMQQNVTVDLHQDKKPSWHQLKSHSKEKLLTQTHLQCNAICWNNGLLTVTFFAFFFGALLFERRNQVWTVQILLWLPCVVVRTVAFPFKEIFDLVENVHTNDGLELVFGIQSQTV